MTPCKKCGADVLVSHATATCRLCHGGPIAPWPPSISGGPTHHTCYPGEERREMCSNQQECNLRAQLRATVEVVAEVTRLIESGYDGPFMGEAIEPLLRAVRCYQTAKRGAP